MQSSLASLILRECSYSIPAMSNSAHSHLWPGVPLALTAAAFFGASTPLAKYLLGSIDPWILAGLLYLGSGLGLSVLIAIRKFMEATGEAGLKRSDLLWLAGT